MIVGTTEFRYSRKCAISVFIHVIQCSLESANTVEPPNNGHGGDKHFVHCSEVVPSSEVLPLSTIIIIISLLNHMNNDITDQG